MREAVSDRDAFATKIGESGWIIFDTLYVYVHCTGQSIFKLNILWYIVHAHCTGHLQDQIVNELRG